MRQPKYNKSIFKERQKRLAQHLGDAAIVVASQPTAIRNNDVEHPYRPDSNLYYLTGFEEPNAVFIFRPGKDPETVLFVQPKDPERETWDGFRYGVEGTKQFFAVDQAFAINEFESMAPDLLLDYSQVYYSLFRTRGFDQRFLFIMEKIKALRGRTNLGVPAILDSWPLLGEMRLRKSPFEVEALTHACRISAEGHIEVMKAIKPGMNERALHGVFLKAIMERGADREAYRGIFATGANATTLHYVFNDQPLRAGDLLLVDAGAEFDYYAGDITRCYPVGDRFTEPQARLYQKVLDVQKRLVQMVKPGLPFSKMQESAIEWLTDVMIDEGLLHGSRSELIKSKAYTAYYMHGVSHFLGMDVHDAGGTLVNGESRRLEPGMVFTVEPGIYIAADNTNARKELRGIGIRIEDDVLVTDSGVEVMTALAPKEISELSAN